MTTEQQERLSEVGKSALSSLREMVAALEVDRDLLADLRRERAALVETVSAEDTDDPDSDEAQIALELWEETHAEELADLEAATRIDGDEVTEEEARERIQEDALSVRIYGERVDGEWQTTEAEILLSTGGPASRIMVELDESGDAHRAYLQVQDWFTPWTDHYEPDMADICLKYASCFYFGE